MQILMLEGPDFAGKTTWAKKFCETNHNVRYFKAVADTTFMDYIHAINSDTYHTLLFDRCWLSEAVYGPILRPDTYDSFKMANDVLRIHQEIENTCPSAIIIRVQPPIKVLLQRMNKRGDAYLQEFAEKLNLTMESLLRKIDDGYNKLFENQDAWNISKWPIIDTSTLIPQEK